MFAAVSCDQPEIPLFGEMIGSSFRLGDNVTFTCTPGFRLKGSMLRRCLPSGSWSGHQPECESKNWHTSPFSRNSVFPFITGKTTFLMRKYWHCFCWQSFLQLISVKRRKGVLNKTKVTHLVCAHLNVCLGRATTPILFGVSRFLSEIVFQS